MSFNIGISYWQLGLTNTSTGSPDSFLWSATNVKIGGNATQNYEFLPSNTNQNVSFLINDEQEVGYSVDITLVTSKNGVAGTPVTKYLQSSITTKEED